MRDDRSESKGRVVDVSESGLGLVTGLDVREGDSIGIELQVPGRQAGIEIRGLVWNRRQRVRSDGGPGALLLGIMITDPPEDYRKLLASLGRAAPAAPSRRRAARPTRGAERVRAPATAKLDRAAPSGSESLVIERTPDAETTLPRPKFPLPPPKLADPESLPIFRVHVKQTNGTRTRRVEVACRSMNDVEGRVHAEYDGEWEVLEITSVGPARR